MTGLPLLTSCTTNSLSYVGANDITGSFSVSMGPNYVYIANLALAHNGLVYVIIGNNNLWTRPPVISEIKTGSGPNGLPPSFFRVLSYKTTIPTSGNMAWTGLTAGSYTMYIVASDDNPFDSANFGTIRSYSISAEVPAHEYFLAAAVLLLLALIF